MIEFKSEVREGALLLTIDGNLIGEEVGSGIIDAANNAIQKNINECVIDISNVKYINSSGIGVLITLLTKFRNQDGELYIVNPSEHIKKLLVITKLMAIFKVAHTVEEALNQLKES